jgi:hypothetical protein
MEFKLSGSKQLVLVMLGAFLVTLLGAVPVKAQCMLTAWMGGGYCYDWLNMYSGKTVRIYPSGGGNVKAQTPFGAMYGQWVAPGARGCSPGCRGTSDLLLWSEKHRAAVWDL